MSSSQYLNLKFYYSFCSFRWWLLRERPYNAKQYFIIVLFVADKECHKISKIINLIVHMVSVSDWRSLWVYNKRNRFEMTTARLELTTNNELYNLSIFDVGICGLSIKCPFGHFKGNTVTCEIFFLIDFSNMKILWISPYLHTQRLALTIFNYQWVLLAPAFLFSMISFAHIYILRHSLKCLKLISQWWCWGISSE